MGKKKIAIINTKKNNSILDQYGSLIELIMSKQTEELVIAFCGALGSGTSFVAKRMQEKLEETGYKTTYIKVSTLIKDAFPEDPRKETLLTSCKAEKTRLLQDMGNELRDKFSSDILAQTCISKVAISRGIDNQNTKKNRTRRHATIIDSLKHPDEYALLEAVYGNMFYLIGVLCPELTRTTRLETEDKFSKQEAVTLTQRDKDEGLENGQQLLATLQHSDFFVRNASENISTLDLPITRYINLMLGKQGITPTSHEYAMHAAQSSALRSACMSRQVGAAILNENNDLVATGRNDVPKSGGGLYGPEDNLNDARCIMRPSGKCQSHEHKNEILSELKIILHDELSKLNVDGITDTIANLDKKVSKIAKLKRLIEFSRAVHAEMDAITTAAKNSSISLKGTSLYCTTFPCHHCARHIIASGISKIYYIEPYEKSLAFDLHSDALEIDASDSTVESNKLLIVPFEGVAPKKYMKMFSMTKRKRNGRRIDIDLKNAKPIIAKFLYTSVEFEAIVATFFSELIESKK